MKKIALVLTAAFGLVACDDVVNNPAQNSNVAAVSSSSENEAAIVSSSSQDNDGLQPPSNAFENPLSEGESCKVEVDGNSVGYVVSGKNGGFTRVKDTFLDNGIVRRSVTSPVEDNVHACEPGAFEEADMEGLVFLSCSEDKTYFYYVIDEENEDGDNVEKRTDTYNFMCSMVNGTYKECIGEAECKAEAEAAAAAAAAEL